jgi:hypothetical protein
MATTVQLRKALAQGAKIVTTNAALKGMEVEYAPQYKGDRYPWRVKGLTGVDRVRTSTCEIQWGPNGAPVKLTETQVDFLNACLKHGGWENSGGWMWANRSTSLRLALALEKKGLLICVNNKPYRERFAPSDLAYRLYGNTLPRLEQSKIDTVLVMLAEQGWQWEPGCGWHYHNESLTKLALEALVSDGYAVRSGDGYGMISAGYTKALELGFDPNLFDDEG